jgi:hypothetical protein
VLNLATRSINIQRISQGDTDSTKHPLDYHHVPIRIAILGASPDFKQTRLIDCYLSSQAQGCFTSESSVAKKVGGGYSHTILWFNLNQEHHHFISFNVSHDDLIYCRCFRNDDVEGWIICLSDLKKCQSPIFHHVWSATRTFRFLVGWSAFHRWSAWGQNRIKNP